MSYYNLPENHLNPPEDDREIVYVCEMCGEEIREGDDYYDIEGFGPCCEDCITSSRHIAELD